jgi:hypothetical protein
VLGTFELAAIFYRWNVSCVRAEQKDLRLRPSESTTCLTSIPYMPHILHSILDPRQPASECFIHTLDTLTIHSTHANLRSNGELSHSLCPLTFFLFVSFPQKSIKIPQASFVTNSPQSPRDSCKFPISAILCRYFLHCRCSDGSSVKSM